MTSAGAGAAELKAANNCQPPCLSADSGSAALNVANNCQPRVRRSTPVQQRPTWRTWATSCPPPTTPTVPPQQCNTGTQSGGAGVTTTGHGLGTAGPTSFLFEFDAFSQPDHFEVYYEGALIYDTGWRGSAGTWTGPDGNPIVIAGPGAGSATVAVPAGSATSITVVVTGQGSGTVWDYTVNCPTPV
ncbi:MAG: hypothetical protein V9E94_18630 [Microthrixaceae bacterium]